MEHNIVVLVVLYNRRVEDSTTIQSLINYCFDDSILIIHNNGPHPVSCLEGVRNKLEESFCVVDLVNCLENKPLSFLYNDTIKANQKAQRFVFLDDDSIITDSFHDAIYKKHSDLEIPKIMTMSDDAIHYPVSNKKVVRVDCELSPINLLSIGSGLIINRTLIDKFNRHNLELFDEHYALYGVDFSLFRRMQELYKKGDAFTLKTSSFLFHSLSRTENNESPFRERERLIDLGISARRYPSLRMFLGLIKRCIYYCISLKLNNVFLILRSYMSGIHSRCQEWKKSRFC